MSQIKLQEQIGGTILHMKGQFVGGVETDQLRDALKSVSDSQKNKLIIDLKETTYLNSTALGVLISAHASFVKRDGKIILCNISKSIENIFVITKLTMVFAITEDLDSAIKELSN